MNLPFTLNISFFYVEFRAKKIKNRNSKSGTGGGQRFMNFIHKIPFFFN